MNQTKKLKTREITTIGMLGAIATVLMLFEIPLPFAPSFYEIDFSEVPVLVGCFAMGPIAGVLIELVKIVLNFVINGTVTAGVGEVANFIIGISFCVPAGLIYRHKKSKKICNNRFGCGNCIYGNLRMFCQCIHSFADLCQSIPNAN